MDTDKRTTSVPLDTDEGERVIEQQNVGAGVELGGGEFPDPRTPAQAPAPGGLTVADVVAEYENAGFAAQFVPEADGKLRCVVCAETNEAASFGVHDLSRVEGVSDPDDMAAVAALTCPNCGARGTVALKYGAEASAEEAEVLHLLAHS